MGVKLIRVSLVSEQELILWLTLDRDRIVSEIKRTGLAVDVSRAGAAIDLLAVHRAVGSGGRSGAWICPGIDRLPVERRTDCRAVGVLGRSNWTGLAQQLLAVKNHIRVHKTLRQESKQRIARAGIGGSHLHR